jgi:hypothetical protein
MFHALFSPNIRSTWLYLQCLVLFIQVAANWCPEWVENLFRTPAGNILEDITRYCKYSQVLLMLGENNAWNM